MDIRHWFKNREDAEKALRAVAVVIMAAGFVSSWITDRRAFSVIGLVIGMPLWWLAKRK